jgi:S-(hydroxymethyl)glutathione dehydrogenase/alcohol dehydrogenase
MFIEPCLPAQRLLMGEHRLQDSLMGSSRFLLELPVCAERYLKGELKLGEMVSDRVALDRVYGAMDAFDDGISARTVIMF